MTGLPIITFGLISIRSVTVITSSGERSCQRKYITGRTGPDSASSRGPSLMPDSGPPGAS